MNTVESVKVFVSHKIKKFKIKANSSINVINNGEVQGSLNLSFNSELKDKIEAPFENLLEKVKNLSGKWHKSQTLTLIEEGPVPFKGNQGSGYTLEALLGIERIPPKHLIILELKLNLFTLGEKFLL